MYISLSTLDHKHLGDIQEACSKLIAMYKDDYKPYCPFCSLINADYGGECDACPWVIFTGYDCFGTPANEADEANNQPQRSFCKQTTVQRLTRLTEWLTAINEELAKR